MVNIIVVILGFIIIKGINQTFRLTEGLVVDTQGASEAKTYTRLDKRYNSVKRLCKFCEGVYDMLPFQPSELELVNFDFWLKRINYRSNVLNRDYTFKEIKGFLYSVTILGAFISLFGILVGGTLGVICLGVGVVGLASNFIFATLASFTIADQNEAIERDVPELYLWLYSKLIAGSGVVNPTLKGYLGVINSSLRINEPMKKFVTTWMGYISTEGENGAIRMMSYYYKSTLVVNLLNIVRQRLDGVDNRDKLITFKTELTALKLNRRRKLAAKRRDQGTSRINKMVYLILTEVLLITLVAKFTVLMGVTRG